MAADYEWFKKKVLAITGIDLNYYRQQQMERRIKSLMEREGHKTYETYTEVLAKKGEQYRTFINHITINVSEYYRNPDRFLELETQILPELLKKTNNLKIWSAACSNGSEPYTISMILEKITPGRRHRIVASDIDDAMIAHAKKGIYEAADIKNVPADIKSKYFEKIGDNYKVLDVIKRKVEFRHHDLLKDRYDTNFDLIVCRNVVIYFTDEAKTKIYTNFFNSLKKGGYLFVGGTERIHNYRALGYQNPTAFFYKHPEE